MSRIHDAIKRAAERDGRLTDTLTSRTIAAVPPQTFPSESDDSDASPSRLVVVREVPAPAPMPPPAPVPEAPSLVALSGRTFGRGDALPRAGTAPVRRPAEVGRKDRADITAQLDAALRGDG